MSESRRVAGSNHIYDSIDNDEPDISPYSITPAQTRPNNTNNQSSTSSTSTPTEASDPPIYATVNKAAKKPPPTAALAGSATVKVPPKTQSKPQPRNSTTPSSPKLAGGTVSKRTITNGDRHVYDVPSDVIKSELPSGETGEKHDGNAQSDDDVVENPYDFIPGQMSPGIASGTEVASVKLRNLSGGREEGTGSKRGWPKLPPLRNSELITDSNASSNNESVSSLKEVSVIYIGSMKITEEELTKEGNSAAVRKCIAQIANPPASPIIFAAIHEWTADLSMKLCIDGDGLRLRQTEGEASLVKDDLLKIRIWGTGKEPDSSIFAYITRDETSSSGFVCRVLKCRDCTGRQVGSMVLDVCKSKLKQTTAGAAGSDAALTEPLQRKGKPDVALQRSSSSETKVTIHCYYVGKFSFTENSSKDELKKLIEIKHSCPRDTWTKVSLEISPSLILVRGSQAQDVIHPTFNVKDITGLGTHKDDNKFGCITTRSGSSSEYIGHVFNCAPTTDHWLLNIQTICRSQLHESKSGIMKKMYKYFTGGKKN